MGMTTLWAMLSAAGVSAANGANDNAKGVATLVGARALNTRRALWLGHLATFAGGLAAVFVARGLIRAFQGAGLLLPAVDGTPLVLLVVGTAAAMTVALATALRLPISTTHALTGGLIGAGLGLSAIASYAPLMRKFLMPLLLSPVAAAVLAGVLYRVLHRIRLAMGVDARTCVCVGVEPQQQWVPVPVRSNGAALRAAPPGAAAHVVVQAAPAAECRQRYTGRVLGVSAAALLDAAHFVSAGATSFARGLNDTPKLAALLVGSAAWLTSGRAVAVVAVAMLLGGWLGARRVLGTMSEHITVMNPGSAATANAVAAALVIAASVFALPVSTTHVTCGALFGIGAAQGRVERGTVGSIVAAWAVTLPMAAVIAFAAAKLFGGHASM